MTGALNYALELETHVLVPLRTALTVHNTPAPWTEHPVPTAKAKDLQLWTLRNEKGRTWLPMFTSAAAACADRSTSARPMADYTLQDAMLANRLSDYMSNLKDSSLVCTQRYTLEYIDFCLRLL